MASVRWEGARKVSNRVAGESWEPLRTQAAPSSLSKCRVGALGGVCAEFVRDRDLSPNSQQGDFITYTTSKESGCDPIHLLIHGGMTRGFPLAFEFVNVWN